MVIGSEFGIVCIGISSFLPDRLPSGSKQKWRVGVELAIGID